MAQIVVHYPDLFALMHDLRAMGENNCVTGRHPMISREILAAAQAIYKSMFAAPDGSLTATFNVVNMVCARGLTSDF